MGDAVGRKPPCRTAARCWLCRARAGWGLRATAAFRPDGSYVNDNVWTSAGVSTGIDMALAMVEQDLGRAVADRVASRSPLRRSFFSILPP